jgi:3-oxoacyl-[acyl-carrier-protein] synthase-3
LTVFLHGLGHFHPENQITNQFLEDLDIGTDDKWIMERVGIQSRRTVLPLDYIRETKNVDVRAGFEAQLYSNAEVGKRAAELAIQRAGIDASDIGMVIAGSSCSDTTSPAEACNVANLLNMEVPSFDVNSACTSFHTPLYLLSMMQVDKLPPYILLVVPDTLTRAVDYRDRSSAVLWGDAAGAAVISTQVEGVAEILGNTLESSPAGNDKVVVPRVSHFHQEGRTVQMFAIKKTIRCYQRLLENHQQPERPFHFVGHQANLRMLESVCDKCEIPPELHHSNVEQFGNTAGAGSASVISQNWDKWTAEDDLAVVGVGSGLTWSSYVMRFGAKKS